VQSRPELLRSSTWWNLPLEKSRVASLSVVNDSQPRGKGGDPKALP
jgi:hypothetical protein